MTDWDKLKDPQSNKKLLRIEQKTKKLERLRKINNSMLGSGAYSDKERDAQIARAERFGDLTTDERTIVERIWEHRKEITLEIIDDLKEYYKGENKNE